MTVKKAVIPVAGFGTRFLPQTKAMPKEMLPIVDKPIVQYVVEELVDAGIEQIVLVTGWHKRAIEDHFDKHFELEAKLGAGGKKEELERVKRLSELAEFIYVRQKEAKGTGDAILTAEPAVGSEPFVLLWGDDFIDATPSRTKQLLKVYKEKGTSILCAIKTDDPEAPEKYGYAAGKEERPGLLKIEKIIEKPGVGKTPSDYAIVSGYLFTPDIFEALHKAEEKIPKDREFYYIDGLDLMIKEGKKVYALEVENAKYYDCGSKIDYLQTVVEMGLKNKELGKEFRKYLKSLKL